MEVIRKIKLTKDESETLLETSYILQEIKDKLDEENGLNDIEKDVINDTVKNIHRIYNLCEES